MGDNDNTPRITVKPAATVPAKAALAKAEPAKAEATRDAACTTLGRHKSGCSCTGEMRAPIVPTVRKR